MTAGGFGQPVARRAVILGCCSPNQRCLLSQKPKRIRQQASASAMRDVGGPLGHTRLVGLSRDLA